MDEKNSNLEPYTSVKSDIIINPKNDKKTI